jgi:predicted nuclease of predicted toxin-antitoxin system
VTWHTRAMTHSFIISTKESDYSIFVLTIAIPFRRLLIVIVLQNTRIRKRKEAIMGYDTVV